MLRAGGWLRTCVLGIAPRHVSVEQRGFHIDRPETRDRLENIGRTFRAGYHAGLATDGVSELARRLALIEFAWRGFAFEGAAMALSLLDHMTPWKRTRLRTFLDGPGEPHAYMVHVGAGWAFARIGRHLDRWMAPLDRLLRWLIVDGYGFHQGYFHWREYVQPSRAPVRPTGYAGRAFDQGLGRSLWFVEGCQPDRVEATVGSFSTSRQSDLWSGVGLACAYAGGAGGVALKYLRTAAGRHRAALAQGAAFAAKARLRAGNPTNETQAACEALCGMSVEHAADVTDQALQGLGSDGGEPAYETWRRRIQAHFATEGDESLRNEFREAAPVGSRVHEGARA